jgi:ribosomal protein S18 acetylase RimI-like enzyme
MAAWYASLLPDNLSFGAYDGSGLIGLAVAQRQEWNDTCVLWELHVDSSWRRRGIGAELIGNVERSAAAAGLRRVWLETQATNPAAIDFYTSAGYEVAGLDLTYYSNRDPATGEVAIFMAKATL